MNVISMLMLYALNFVGRCGGGNGGETSVDASSLTWSVGVGSTLPLLEDVFSLFSLSLRKGSCLMQQNCAYSLAKPSKHDLSLSQFIYRKGRERETQWRGRREAGEGRRRTRCYINTTNESLQLLSSSRKNKSGYPCVPNSTPPCISRWAVLSHLS